MPLCYIIMYVDIVCLHQGQISRVKTKKQLARRFRFFSSMLVLYLVFLLSYPVIWLFHVTH